MKKLLLVIIVACIGFVACEKECDHDDIPCAEVDPKLVPAVVMDSLNARFPGVVVIKWFNKDNKGYCAHFEDNGKKMSALLANDGRVLKIEEDDDYTTGGKDNDDDDDDDDDGCECELD